jgi:inactivated superfamily I helicase
VTVRLTDKSNGAVIGAINRDELQFLIDNLEEESSRDADYFIDQATVEILAEVGGNASLITMLRNAVGTSDGIDVEWESV